MQPATSIHHHEIAKHPAIRALIDTLCAQYGDSVSAILLYGSCLRSGDPLDGLVDLYVLVDSYRLAYRKQWLAMANALLPPNVFYRAITYIDPSNQETCFVRSKYAILSIQAIKRGVSKRWFQAYIWGRFTQPFAVVYCRDQSSQQQMDDCRITATATFLDRVLPRLPAHGTIESLWSKGLQLSYRSELRAESTKRSRELVHAARDYYVAITSMVAPTLHYRLKVDHHGDRTTYHCHIRAISRWLSRMTWSMRIIQGKLLSILRLLKALSTFQGGLDYAVWKLERHSGQRIEIPPKVRRYPWLFMWGFCWRLYRRGLFR